MRPFTISGLVVALMAVTAVLQAQDMPEMPQMPEMPPPQKEHQWLQRFVGEWDTEAELMMAPDQPPTRAKGSESVRALGGFWVVGEGKSEMMGQPFSYLITLGYDVEKQKYVASWVDSMSGRLWISEGSVDSTGNTLTLESEGPCPLEPGTMANFRDVIEFKSDDHRVLTASMQVDDGEWTTMMTVNFRRKE